MLIQQLKALVVVLGIAIVVFYLARSIATKFSSADDFVRRRNIWLSLTVLAFVSPSFWVFALVSAPLLAWGARRDSNVLAFYLMMMQVIPQNITVEIPTVGIQQLFAMSGYRVLAIVVLLPVAWRLLSSGAKAAVPGRAWMDACIIGFGLLQIVWLLPYESTTHAMRRIFLFVLDVWLLYFVASRVFTDGERVREAMAAFVLVCAIWAPIAVFESLKGWLLYYDLGGIWGAHKPFPYLYRAGSLRAEVTAGHALPLGYLLAIGFGFWLYLASRIGLPRFTWLVSVVLWGGLIATYSRAPWLVGVLVFFAYLGFGPNGAVRFVKAAAAMALVTAAALVSPAGQQIVDRLPFVGTIDAETVVYRQQLAERSWEVIWENPLFGSPFVLLRLEDLRQGQGIIDLVNTYAQVTLYYGVVGLGVFLGAFLIGMGIVLRHMWAMRAKNPDLAQLGASLVACMIGTLFMMATGSFGGGLSQMYWILAGLAACYSVVARVPAGAPMMLDAVRVTKAG